MMKLGTDTGSMTNHIYSCVTSPNPEIGMGATVLYWTDREAGTVIEITTIGNKALVAVQEDHAVRVDENGISEDQTYTFSCNPEGRIWYFRQEKDGKWQEVRKNAMTGRWGKAVGGCGLSLGARRKYFDFSF